MPRWDHYSGNHRKETKPEHPGKGEDDCDCFPWPDKCPYCDKQPKDEGGPK